MSSAPGVRRERWTSGAPAMMGAAHIRLPGHGEPAYAAAPMVERRDVDLPPMILSYAFAGWDKSTLKVETKLDWGAGAYSLQTRSWPADAAGVVHLPVVGGEMLIKAIPGDEGSIDVVSFTPGPAASEPGEP